MESALVSGGDTRLEAFGRRWGIPVLTLGRRLVAGDGDHSAKQGTMGHQPCPSPAENRTDPPDLRTGGPIMRNSGERTDREIAHRGNSFWQDTGPQSRVPARGVSIRFGR